MAAGEAGQLGIAGEDVVRPALVGDRQHLAISFGSQGSKWLNALKTWGRLDNPDTKGTPQFLSAGQP